MRTLLVVLNRLNDTVKKENVSATYSCICGRWYRQKHKLRNHVKRNRKKLEESSGVEPRNDVHGKVKCVRCQTCGKSFKCKPMLKEPVKTHIKRVSRINSTCDCSLGWNSWATLTQEAKNYLKQIGKQDAFARKVSLKESKGNVNFVVKAKIGRSNVASPETLDLTDDFAVHQGILKHEATYKPSFAKRMHSSATESDSDFTPSKVKKLDYKSCYSAFSACSKASVIPNNEQITQLDANGKCDSMSSARRLSASKNNELEVHAESLHLPTVIACTSNIQVTQLDQNGKFNVKHMPYDARRLSASRNDDLEVSADKKSLHLPTVVACTSIAQVTQLDQNGKFDSRHVPDDSRRLSASRNDDLEVSADKKSLHLPTVVACTSIAQVTQLDQNGKFDSRHVPDDSRRLSASRNDDLEVSADKKSLHLPTVVACTSIAQVTQLDQNGKFDSRHVPDDSRRLSASKNDDLEVRADNNSLPLPTATDTQGMQLDPNSECDTKHMPDSLSLSARNGTDMEVYAEATQSKARKADDIKLHLLTEIECSSKVLVTQLDKSGECDSRCVPQSRSFSPSTSGTLEVCTEAIQSKARKADNIKLDQLAVITCPSNVQITQLDQNCERISKHMPDSLSFNARTREDLEVCAEAVPCTVVNLSEKKFHHRTVHACPNKVLVIQFEANDQFMPDVRSVSTCTSGELDVDTVATPSKAKTFGKENLHKDRSKGSIASRSIQIKQHGTNDQFIPDVRSVSTCTNGELDVDTVATPSKAKTFGKKNLHKGRSEGSIASRSIQIKQRGTNDQFIPDVRSVSTCTNGELDVDTVATSSKAKTFGKKNLHKGRSEGSIASRSIQIKQRGTNDQFIPDVRSVSTCTNGELVVDTVATPSKAKTFGKKNLHKGRSEGSIASRSIQIKQHGTNDQFMPVVQSVSTCTNGELDVDTVATPSKAKTFGKKNLHKDRSKGSIASRSIQIKQHRTNDQFMPVVQSVSTCTNGELDVDTVATPSKAKTFGKKNLHKGRSEGSIASRSVQIKQRGTNDKFMPVVQSVSTCTNGELDVDTVATPSKAKTFGKKNLHKGRSEGSIASRGIQAKQRGTNDQFMPVVRSVSTCTNGELDVDTVATPSKAKTFGKKNLHESRIGASVIPRNVQVKQFCANYNFGKNGKKCNSKLMPNPQSLAACSRRTRKVHLMATITKNFNKILAQSEPKLQPDVKHNLAELPIECQLEESDCEESVIEDEDGSTQPVTDLIDLTAESDSEANHEVLRSTNMLKCKTCDIAFHSSDKLQKHLSAHVKCKCYICGEKIKSDSMSHGCIEHIHAVSPHPCKVGVVLNDENERQCSQHHLLQNTILVLHQECTPQMQGTGATSFIRKPSSFDNGGQWNTNATKSLYECYLCRAAFTKKVYMKAHVFRMHLDKVKDTSYNSYGFHKFNSNAE